MVEIAMADIVVECPACRRKEPLDEQSSEAFANDNVSHIDIASPTGFRKVQVGWNSDRFHFFCVDCGVPARLAGLDPGVR